MHEVATQAVQSIQRLLGTLVEEIHACIDSRIPDVTREYGETERKLTQRDIEYHLTYLCEALSVATPGLFLEYVKWCKVLFAGLHLPEVILPTTLACMDAVLCNRLPAEQQNVVHDYLEEALRILPEAPTVLPSLLVEAPPFDQLSMKYLEALRKGDRDAGIRLILSAVQNGIRIQDIYLRVFQPVMREVGRLWQMHQISVAQEHFITAATQLIMALLSPSILATPKKELRLVAVSVSGELHELGARMVADFFEMAGWHTYYLGANVPSESVISAILQTKADALVVSATLPTHVSAVRDLIASVHNSDACDVVILVGGYPFNIAPDLWSRIGADGSAPDAPAAVEVAEHLVTIAQNRQRQPLQAVTAPAETRTAAPRSINPLYEDISRLNNELVSLHRELQQKNSVLDELIEQKNRLLGMASHDLRNPLSIILGYSQFLHDNDADNLTAQQRDYIEKIIASSKFMLTLVNDLLSTAQLESGRLILDLQPVSLGAVCQRVVDTSHDQADEKQITVRCISDPLPELLLDPMRMEQALQNLVSNAIKFSPAHASVEVIVHQQDDEATISVIDHGRGMSAEEVQGIFAPFSSAKAGTAGERGTGLGLAITKRIIEAHHGHIQVKSTAGSGSIFTIMLPLNKLD